MGEVWRATDLVLDRPVAVKLLRSQFAEDDGEELARFRAEARHAGSLSHQGIAQIYDYHEGAPPAVPYLVMELVDGPSLSRLLDAGPLEPARTMDLIAQAAWALQAAHAAGLVHRDIKPGNLLVTRGGQVKVTDFGISHAEGSEPLTRTGVMIGTPAYLAPEQASGAHATPASDLYSLGIVAFQCLTGGPPFHGPPLAVALAHQERPLPPLPPSVPAQVARLVFDLTAKDPRARPASAGEVAQRAERLRMALTAAATRELGTRDGRRARQSVYAASAAAAVVAIAAMGWIITGVHGAAPMHPHVTTQPTRSAATRQLRSKDSNPAQRSTHKHKHGVTVAATAPSHSSVSNLVSVATSTPTATLQRASQAPAQTSTSSTPTPTSGPTAAPTGTPPGPTAPSTSPVTAPSATTFPTTAPPASTPPTSAPPTPTPSDGTPTQTGSSESSPSGSPTAPETGGTPGPATTPTAGSTPSSSESPASGTPTENDTSTDTASTTGSAPATDGTTSPAATSTPSAGGTTPGNGQ
jgi:serine/threonine protein kinase